MAKACGANRLKIFGDSNLIVQQVMTAYRDMYNAFEATFDGCDASHTARASNKEADTLAKIKKPSDEDDPKVRLGGCVSFKNPFACIRKNHGILDATIFNISDEQRTLREPSRSSTKRLENFSRD
jgi:hypothetical protein